jgi:hypothetical protein
VKILLIGYAIISLPAFVIFSLLFNNSNKDGEYINIAKQLNKHSVTIICKDGSRGSGVEKHVGEWSYIWTDQHVIQEHSEVIVCRTDLIDLVSMSSVKCIADVVAISEPDDIALLRVRQKKLHVGESTNFYLQAAPVQGDKVVHVSSFGALPGEIGANSFSIGIISQLNKKAYDISYDFVTTTACPGSSGGGVFLKRNLECIGLVCLGWDSGLIYITPSRRILEWSKRNGVSWAIVNKETPPKDAIVQTMITKHAEAIVAAKSEERSHKAALPYKPPSE